MERIFVIINCLISITNALTIPVNNNEYERVFMPVKLSEKTKFEFWIKVAITIFLVLVGGLFAGICIE